MKRPLILTVICLVSFVWAAVGQTRAPDSVVTGAALLAARAFLAELASQGYTTDAVNWGNRRDAAAACAVSENMLAAIENGQTDFIPGKLVNCYRWRIEALTYRAQRQNISAIVGVGGSVVDRTGQTAPAAVALDPVLEVSDQWLTDIRNGVWGILARVAGRWGEFSGQPTHAVQWSWLQDWWAWQDGRVVAAVDSVLAGTKVP